ncbi:MAG: phosphotransferase, partial [bacterium]
MAHVAGKFGASCCPQVCSTKSGAQITTVQDADNAAHFVRLLTYLPGEPFATFTPHSPALLEQFGKFMGRMSTALAGFEHPAGKQYLKWNMANAPHEINRHIEHIIAPERRALVESFLDQYEKQAAPQLPELRTSIIHGDANDHNILVGCEGVDAKISGIIDFGDIVESYTACDLAIAVAYAILDKANPISAAAHIVRGYHSIFPLTETEIELLYDFICMRLCLSATMSSYQQKMEPDNAYLKISEKPAWAALEILRSIHPRFAHYVFRHACGLPPCPAFESVQKYLKNNAPQIRPVIDLVLKTTSKHVFDLSIGSTEFPNDGGEYEAQRFTDLLFGRMRQANAKVGVGRYNEARRFYLGDAFKTGDDEYQEWRTIHVGIDLFLEPGAPIFAPLDGTVHSFRNNATPFDYGPAIILEHTFDNGSIKF